MTRVDEYCVKIWNSVYDYFDYIFVFATNDFEARKAALREIKEVKVVPDQWKICAEPKIIS